MDYEFEFLTREIIIVRLSHSENATAAAADLARSILATAIMSTEARQERHLTILSVCRGAMEGLRAVGETMPEAAVALLEQIYKLAKDTHNPEMLFIEWAVEGIESAIRRAPEPDRMALRAAIERRYPGTAAIFDNVGLAS